jgi:hypothetical protein
MSESPNPADLLGSNLPPLQSAPKKTAKGLPDRVWIQLEESDEIPPTGQFFGVNGVGYLIRPGEPVHVPASLIEVLDHCVMTAPVVDNITKQVVGHRQRMRFPYRRIEAPEVTE